MAAEGQGFLRLACSLADRHEPIGAANAPADESRPACLHWAGLHAASMSPKAGHEAARVLRRWPVLADRRWRMTLGRQVPAQRHHNDAGSHAAGTSPKAGHHSCRAALGSSAAAQALAAQALDYPLSQAQSGCDLAASTRLMPDPSLLPSRIGDAAPRAPAIAVTGQFLQGRQIAAASS